MGVLTAAARNPILYLPFFAFLVLATIASPPASAQRRAAAAAQTQTPGASYEEKKRQANDIAVSVVVSGLSCTCARFTEDIRNVVNDLSPDGIRVLPVLGVGGLQNVNDVLFLKNIDMGVVDEDNLRLLKQKDPALYANIEQRIQYITKLYNSEFHVLARDDIKSYDDLRGKKVNFNLKDSQTEVTADTVFNSLNIPVQRSYYDNDEAIKRLIAGDISAMIILTGAPQAALAKLKKEDGVHFLALDQESLPNHDLNGLFAEYLPAELTHDLYPNLVPEGTTVPTVANRALLVAYAWPENSEMYKRIAKFVEAFFSKIDQFNNPSRHPKWREVNLAAEMPGWVRYKPAADWLAAHKNQPVSANADGTAGLSTAELRLAFDKFMQTYASASGGKELSPRDREALFVRFKESLAGSKATQASAR
ncbi:MAG TPA: TAXI family TRAP transporter solute-binding subunit [Bradyrhizobium sp.]|uniref:TAXI family TRAP transporter solute-binding subunit n=1 Tax=Bradyrhizobium sp. TaxID=376 RepID=UPI002D7EF574|nr:TAXI family TRAP transporter solute-binding subunit [Bradyrhizobium sp.]HET7886525.1 TAXI family TRAP transporter solute-binding subunit [Bradyrhizobium sp.]